MLAALSSSRRHIRDTFLAAPIDDVTTLGAGPVVELVPGEGELRLAEPLKGKQFILLDDLVGGRSAFELHILMKATPEAKEARFGLLSASGADSTVRAAWLAGFDLFLTQPVDPAKLGAISYRCAGERAINDGAGTA